MKEKTLKQKIMQVYGKAGVLIILLLMVIILAVLRPDTFFTYRNLINIVRQVSFYAMVGLGAMVVLVGGDFDLSAGSLIGIVSILTTMPLAANANLPLIVPFLVAIAAGVVVGIINGVLVAYCGMPAFIATLGMQILLRGLALYISNGRPINNLPSNFTFLGGGSLGIIPVPIIILIIMALITWYMMKYTRIGRHIYAIGGNSQAAIVSGVNAKALKVFTFIFAGITAAIAGMVLTARVASGNASSGEGYELQAIAGCVIGGVSLNGGVGSVYGVICGVLVIGVLNNGMDLMNVSGYMQQIAQGIIIIAAVLLDVVRAKTAK